MDMASKLLTITFTFTDDHALEFDFGSLGLHCLLRLSSAGLIVVLIPGCYWAYTACSV